MSSVRRISARPGHRDGLHMLRQQTVSATMVNKRGTEVCCCPRQLSAQTITYPEQVNIEIISCGQSFTFTTMFSLTFNVLETKRGATDRIQHIKKH